MSNDNLPKKPSFLARLISRFFNSKKEENAALLEEIDRLKRENENNKAEIAKLEQEKEEKEAEISNLKEENGFLTKKSDKYERLINESDTNYMKENKELKGKIAKLTEEKDKLRAENEGLKAKNEGLKAENEVLIAEEISASEIITEQGKEGAEITVFFEKYIIEATEKLKSNISVLENVTENDESKNKTKEELITNYRSDLLGSLLAYMELDTTTQPEIKKEIEREIQKSMIDISSKHPKTEKSFIKAYVSAKYEAYDGRFMDPETYKVYRDLDSLIYDYFIFANEGGYFQGRNDARFRDVIETGFKKYANPYGKREKTIVIKDMKEHFLKRRNFDNKFEVRGFSREEKLQEGTDRKAYAPDLLRALKENEYDGERA